MVAISTREYSRLSSKMVGSGYTIRNLSSKYLFERQNDSVNTSLSNYGRTMNKTTMDGNRIGQDCLSIV